MAEPHVCVSIDANGNLTSDGTKSYSWNALNQLVEVKEGSTTIAIFEYDGKGQRTEKVSAGLTHTYIYDVEDIVEERITGSTSDTIRYYHGAGIDEPLARANGSAVTTYYLADHLGSIVQETTAAGTVALEREYDPWGVALQGAAISGYAFTGREWDAEIGLNYYRARYYEPGRARFLSDDPIGLAGGANQQRYVSNSPTRFTDPYGLQAMSCRPQLDLMKKVDEFFGRDRTDQERKDEIMSTLIPPPAMIEIPIAGGRVVNSINMKEDHYFLRKWGRELNPETILRTLKNPSEIVGRIDQFGRESFKYMTDQATVVVNNTGKIITMWRNSGGK